MSTETTTNLTYEQGLVIGLIMAGQVHRNMHRLLASVASVEGAYDAGVNFFKELETKYTGKVLPEFPEGVPTAAFDPVDEFVTKLLMADEL